MNCAQLMFRRTKFNTEILLNRKYQFELTSVKALSYLHQRKLFQSFQKRSTRADDVWIQQS